MRVESDNYADMPINILLKMGKKSIEEMEKQYQALNDASKERLVEVFLGKMKALASYMPEFAKITGKSTVSIVNNATLPILAHSHKDVPHFCVQLYHDGNFSLRLSEGLERGDYSADPSFCGDVIFSSTWVDWDKEYNVIAEDIKPYDRLFYFSDHVIPIIIAEGPSIEKEAEQKMADALCNKLESVKMATENYQRIAALQMEGEMENNFEMEE